MNKYYDKLLFVITFLVLLAGVGFYVTSSDGGLANGPLNNQLSGAPYEVIPVPKTVAKDVLWPSAKDQSTGWNYDVFTPPKIYLENGKFTNIPYEEIVVVPPPPFGIYLSTIDRVPYRIQLVGYIEEDLSDSSKSLMLFVDEESGDNVRGRLDGDLSKYEFTVKNFEITRMTEDGMMLKVAKVTIFDQRSGQEVILTHGERLYDDGVTVVLKSNEDPSILIELADAPAPFETTLGSYVLEEINLEGSSVTVTKLGNEDFEPETKLLQMQIISPSSKDQPQTEASPVESESSIFDAIF